MIGLWIVLGLSAGAAFANEAGKGALLEFEAELIEGERRSPEMFLQLDSDQMKLETILYDRKDFNDFHRPDRVRRPALPRVGGGGP